VVLLAVSPLGAERPRHCSGSWSRCHFQRIRTYVGAAPESRDDQVGESDFPVSQAKSDFSPLWEEIAHQTRGCQCFFRAVQGLRPKRRSRARQHRAWDWRGGRLWAVWQRRGRLRRRRL